VHSFRSFFLLLRRPPLSPLFPYTTLFRSIGKTSVFFFFRADKRPRLYSRNISGIREGCIRVWKLRVRKSDQRTSIDHLLRDAIVDRKSTRLNSSHVSISYAVFCLKKKTHN